MVPPIMRIYEIESPNAWCLRSRRSFALILINSLSIEWCIRRLINITCDISGFGFLGFVLGWMNNIANN